MNLSKSEYVIINRIIKYLNSKNTKNEIIVTNKNEDFPEFPHKIKYVGISEFGVKIEGPTKNGEQFITLYNANPKKNTRKLITACMTDPEFKTQFNKLMED